MLDEARRRAAAAGVTAEFEVGDAMALAFPDDTFDASRSERTFQWLPNAGGGAGRDGAGDPARGAVVVIDSDWATFSFDHPDQAVTRKSSTSSRTAAPEQTRRPPPGAAVPRPPAWRTSSLAARAAVFTEWDPDTQPGPPGLMPHGDVHQTLVGGGGDHRRRGRVVAGARLTQLARDGDFCAALTIYAACGTQAALPA